MRIFLGLMASFALAAAPTAALAKSASTRLILIIPVHCSIDALGGSIENDRIVLQVHRSCNTGHSVVVSGGSDPELSEAVVHYNGDTRALASEVVLPQPERYYDEMDNVVIELPGGDLEDMQRLAASLHMSVLV